MPVFSGLPHSLLWRCTLERSYKQRFNALNSASGRLLRDYVAWLVEHLPSMHDALCCLPRPHENCGARLLSQPRQEDQESKLILVYAVSGRSA